MKDFKTFPFPVNDVIVALAKKDNDLLRKHKAEQKASNQVLWAAIHSQYPELDIDANYVLKCEYVEQGIAMLDTAKSNGLPESLSKLLKALK